jgi:hypothetical protein
MVDWSESRMVGSEESFVPAVVAPIPRLLSINLFTLPDLLQTSNEVDSASTNDLRTWNTAIVVW